MANMNVAKRLEKISNELSEVVKYVVQYHGVDSKEARLVDNIATDIAEQSAALAGLARESQGDRSAGKLRKQVRKALGFTVP